MIKHLKESSKKTFIGYDTKLPILGEWVVLLPDIEGISKKKFYQYGSSVYISAKNFKQNLKNYLFLKLDEYVKNKIAEMNLEHEISVRISITKSKWGTCVRKKNSYTLQFCIYLIFAPVFVIDYVIYHELAHIKHMDHSEKFWLQVESYCKDYKEAKNWLKLNGKVLSQYQIT